MANDSQRFFLMLCNDGAKCLETHNVHEVLYSQEGNMKKCDACSENIKDGDARELHSRTLCEDCYMDALSPAHDCDPWAVYLAKASAGKGGEKIQLTKTQIEIMEVVKESGGIEMMDLQQRLEMKVTDLEKEIVTLRHMELLKSEPVGGKTILKLLH